MTAPPFTITPEILSLVASIGEQVGRLEASLPPERQLLLRRANRLRTIQGSLAIEGNTLSLDQVTAVVEGKRVLGTVREVQEVHGAVAAYEAMGEWDSTSRDDLLAAHGVLMAGLVDQPGAFRSGSAGIQRGDELVHVAPPAANVRGFMNDLLAWLAASDDHPLIQACVFHYEFEFIHPFVDGNGRMGRLWQTLILSRWKLLFALVPVESIVHDHQQGYYEAINRSDGAGNSTPFILFMLEAIHEALGDLANTPPANRPVTPPVDDKVAGLLRLIRHKSLGAQAIREGLGLKDRTYVRKSYLDRALSEGLIEQTIPDKPHSRNQQYRLTELGRRALQELLAIDAEDQPRR